MEMGPGGRNDRNRVKHSEKRRKGEEERKYDREKETISSLLTR
jgi:hypothetical protein